MPELADGFRQERFNNTKSMIETLEYQGIVTLDNVSTTEKSVPYTRTVLSTNDLIKKLNEVILAVNRLEDGYEILDDTLDDVESTLIELPAHSIVSPEQVVDTREPDDDL